MAASLLPLKRSGFVRTAYEHVDIAVACPQVQPLIDVAQRHQFEDALSARIFRGVSTDRELERRLAHTLKAEAFARGATKSSQARFDDRPATEPALRPLWPKLMGHTRIADIDNLLNALLGETSVHRQHRSTTRYAHDGTRSVFPPVHEARGWLGRIDASEGSETDPLAQACFAYAQTVLSHPYQDGNGRLARAMYQRSLGRSGLLSGPLLPLGPLVYANHRVHDRALQHLGSAGDWSPFVAVMLGLTRKAAAFTAWTLSGERSLPYQNP